MSKILYNQEIRDLDGSLVRTSEVYLKDDDKTIRKTVKKPQIQNDDEHLLLRACIENYLEQYNFFKKPTIIIKYTNQEIIYEMPYLSGGKFLSDIFSNDKSSNIAEIYKYKSYLLNKINLMYSSFFNITEKMKNKLNLNSNSIFFYNDMMLDHIYVENDQIYLIDLDSCVIGDYQQYLKEYKKFIYFIDY